MSIKTSACFVVWSFTKTLGKDIARKIAKLYLVSCLGYDKALQYSAKHLSSCLNEFLIDNPDKISIDRAFLEAAKYGNLSSIKRLFPKARHRNTAILSAMEQNRVEVVEFLLKSIDCHCSLAIVAARRGGVEILKALTSYRINWNKCMAEAIENEHTEVIKFISKQNKGHGALFSSKLKDKDTLRSIVENGCEDWNNILLQAAYVGDMNITLLALEKKATSIQDAAAFAAFSGHVDIVKLLIEMGADNIEQIMSNAGVGGRVEVIKALPFLEYHLAPIMASIHGHLEEFILLSERKDEVKASLVLEEIKSGKTSVFKYCIERRFDKGVIEYWSRYCEKFDDLLLADKETLQYVLHKAVERGNAKLVKFLLDNNIALDYASLKELIKLKETDLVKEIIGKQPLTRCQIMNQAAKFGNVELVKFFLERKVGDWNFPMEKAAKHGHREIVEMLIAKGAYHFNRALIAAAKGGQEEIIDLMIQHGASNFGTAMVMAARSGHIFIVEKMMNLGASNIMELVETAIRCSNIDILKLVFDRYSFDLGNIDYLKPSPDVLAFLKI